MLVKPDGYDCTLSAEMFIQESVLELPDGNENDWSEGTYRLLEFQVEWLCCLHLWRVPQLGGSIRIHMCPAGEKVSYL